MKHCYAKDLKNWSRADCYVKSDMRSELFEHSNLGKYGNQMYNVL